MKLIKYGFEIEGKKYGFFKKEIYILPYVSENKNYKLRKLKPQLKRYRIGKGNFSLTDLEQITILLSNPFIVNQINDPDTPF